MGNSHRIVFSLLFLFLPVAFLQDACETKGGKQASPDSTVPRLQAAWTGQKVSLTFEIENTTDQPTEFKFRNSGRVCGVIRDPQGNEIHRFPEITAQVIGSETLAPKGKLTFQYEVSAEQLAPLAPGEYPVEAWLCGYKQFRAGADFAIPAQD